MASSILLSGSTGAVGSRLVPELLQIPDTRLTLLVRGDSQLEADRRIRRVLRFWGVDLSDPRVARRFRIVKGDIACDRLGLDDGSYAALASELTHLIHCAADIKLNLPIEEARRVNLTGTEQMLRLAEACADKGQFRGLSYLSTAEVAGNYRGVVREEYLTEYRREFLNTYEVAKAETEERLRQWGERGYPVTVYRPSMVVGDSVTGKTTRFGTFYYLLSDLLLSPRSRLMPGSRDFVIDAVPVDFVAQVVRHLHDDPRAIGKVYNVTAGLHEAWPMYDFVHEARRVLEPVLGTALSPPRMVPARPVYWLLKALRAPSYGQMRRNIERQLIFISFLFLKVRFDNSKLLEAIAPHGMSLPNLMEYLPALCRYYSANRQGRGGTPRELAPGSGPAPA